MPVKKIGTWLIGLGLLMGLMACSGKSSSSSSDVVTLALSMTRLPQVGVDPFQVRVSVLKNGSGWSGQMLTLSVPKGAVSSVTDNSNGTYDFTVTPSVTGTYPVTVSIGGKSITRKAVVLDTQVSDSKQPMAIPGDFVNTAGYEDGITITPDGQYLFVQYGPFYFAGIFNFTTICSSGAFSAGYDLNTCDGRTNSGLVFDTNGPYAGPYRPDFPVGGIVSGKLRHLPDLIIGGVANGIVAFPTVFYGFKKQADGTFAEPFKVAFDDARGVNGPFGLSFLMNGDGTAKFAVAWNNYLDDLGDDKPDIYSGTLTLGNNKSLGSVVYSGDTFASITPTIAPVSFSSHANTQGNPHLFANSSGVITSIWTDDEQATLDLSVYRLTSGTYPNGTWVKDNLPAVINTGAHERQPFFTGEELILTRENQIVSHEYRPANGSCASVYTHADCWGPEVVLIGANGNSSTGEIFAVGEPTIATVDGQKILYFVYVEARSIVGGMIDWNLEAASVEIP